MATAYAAIVYLIHLIDETIPIYLARRPKIFWEKQFEHRHTIFWEKQLGIIRHKACLIQDYLEVHSHRDSNEAQDLKRRIVNASYATLDVIESHFVDDIKASILEGESKEKVPPHLSLIKKWKLRYGPVSKSIHKVIQDMDLITKIIMEIEDVHPNHLTTIENSFIPHPTTIHHDIVVGFDDHLTRIMEKLTGQPPTLQIIPITGMGGIGKTTLAQNIYGNSLINKHFDICGWVTVSQVYKIEQILLDLLHSVGVNIKENGEYHHLGKMLYQHLSGRMYLIIVDDLWNTDAWDKIKLFLPDTKGSRIMITTRLKDVANYRSFSNLYEINLLDENTSWSLLNRKTFGQEGCPHPELEEVGKKIAKQCRGLPLSIAVIGGLLAKSKMTLASWEYVAENIKELISSDDNDCLDILLLSYKHLPVHLQPCFLYVGVFPEDRSIYVSELINLWVAEGFLKPSKLKTLEEVAEDYLKDLTERHLIMVNEWGSLGTMKSCIIHDLLRDLCLREAHKEKFILVNVATKHEDPSEFIIEHRIAIQHVMYDWPSQHAVDSTLLVRSLTCKREFKVSHIPNFKLLRLFNVFDDSRIKIYNEENKKGFLTQEFDIGLLNLRLMRLSTVCLIRSIHWVHRLWNLHTLVIHDKIAYDFTLQIWKMPQLRHLICRGNHINISDPQHGRIDDSVLENLQTLSGIGSFKCTKEVVRRIPNVKKLAIYYNRYRKEEAESLHYLKNIGHLHNLQSLTLLFETHYSINGREYFKNCGFPHLLKKLTLITTGECTLKDIITRIGELPYLEKMKLKCNHTEEEWNPVEGQFVSLKVLKLESFYDLIYWNADSSHFPALVHLHLYNMSKLKEIPFDIGGIETLQSITLNYCTPSAVDSAKNILEEQQSFGNENFRLVC